MLAAGRPAIDRAATRIRRTAGTGSGVRLAPNRGTASTIDFGLCGAENGGMDGVNPVAGQPAGPAAPVPRGNTWQDTFGPPVRPPQAPRDRGAWRRDVLRLLREPFTRRAIAERRYAALSFLLAIPGFVFVVAGIVVGLALS